MTNTILSLRDVAKSFADQNALLPTNLDVKNGEFLTLLGPSGCGKTTLLRLISGFETPDQGCILLNNKDITNQAPEERHINMVFQNYALFPHMNVFQNVAFGLECQGMRKKDIEPLVIDALTRVKLEHLRDRNPSQLSGGQQQRVAIARALVKEPAVLLLDEPLSALDYVLRKEMRIELKALQRRLGITFILVTHDQEEALMLSDRVVVMNAGCIEQIGTPRDVYEEPKNLFVTKFIGEANIFEAIVLEASEEKLTVNLLGHQFILKNTKQFHAGDAVKIVIRPEDIAAWNKKEVGDDTEGLIPGKVAEVIYKGSTVDLVIILENEQRVFATAFFDEDDDKLDYGRDEEVYLDWKVGWEVILPNI